MIRLFIDKSECFTPSSAYTEIIKLKDEAQAKLRLDKTNDSISMPNLIQLRIDNVLDSQAIAIDLQGQFITRDEKSLKRLPDNKFLLTYKGGIVMCQYDAITTSICLYTREYVSNCMTKLTQDPKAFADECFNSYLQYMYSLLRYKKILAKKRTTNIAKRNTSFCKEERHYIETLFYMPIFIKHQNVLSFELDTIMKQHPIFRNYCTSGTISNIHGSRIPTYGNIKEVWVYAPAKDIMEYMNYSRLSDINIPEVQERILRDSGYNIKLA